MKGSTEKNSQQLVIRLKVFLENGLHNLTVDRIPTYELEANYGNGTLRDVLYRRQTSSFERCCTATKMYCL